MELCKNICVYYTIMKQKLQDRAAPAAVCICLRLPLTLKKSSSLQKVSPKQFINPLKQSGLYENCTQVSAGFVAGPADSIRVHFYICIYVL